MEYNYNIIVSYKFCFPQNLKKYSAFAQVNTAKGKTCCRASCYEVFQFQSKKFSLSQQLHIWAVIQKWSEEKDVSYIWQIALLKLINQIFIHIV